MLTATHSVTNRRKSGTGCCNSDHHHHHHCGGQETQVYVNIIHSIKVTRSKYYFDVIFLQLVKMMMTLLKESWLTSTQQEVRKYVKAQLLQEDNDDNLH